MSASTGVWDIYRTLSLLPKRRAGNSPGPWPTLLLLPDLLRGSTCDLTLGLGLSGGNETVLISGLGEDVIKEEAITNWVWEPPELNYPNSSMKLRNIWGRCQLPRICRMSFTFLFTAGTIRSLGTQWKSHWNTQWQKFRTVGKFWKCLLVQSLWFYTWGVNVSWLSLHFYYDLNY